MVNHLIPTLKSADKKPIQPIEIEFLKQHSAIESWFRKLWLFEPIPLMSSVDIRHSGYKISSVDANLFPAGFNNISHDFIPMSVQALQYVLTEQFPSIQEILIISENHTRNKSYFESIYQLQQIFQLAGYHVKVGQIDGINETTHVETSLGHFDLWPVERRDNRLIIGEFNPKLIVLNRDLSEGIPKSLENLDQPITPPIRLGWSSRLKSNHFRHYEEITSEFASQFGIDPWLISPFFKERKSINFITEIGLDELAKDVEEILEKIHAKYKEYKIHHSPFVVVKAEAGTYGMCVMMVKSGNEILNLNRKQKARMAFRKGKQEVNQVIVQEGIYSFETWEEAVAEPVVYLIGQSVVGGFYRIHREKGIRDNLNTPGMEFKALAFSQACNVPSDCNINDVSSIRFYAYSVIARLSLLACIREFKEALL